MDGEEDWKLVDRKKKNKQYYPRNTNKSIADNYFNDSEFDLYIRKSRIPNAGFGVFTNSFIPKDTVIGEYIGDIIESYKPQYTTYSFEIIKPDEENGIMGYGIDCLALPRCYMSMINDAQFSNRFTNNCDFDQREKERMVYVFSTRDIRPGEELFIDYGPYYWKAPGIPNL
jgi:hypothetical protein